MSEAALHKAVSEFLGWTLKPPFWWSTIGHGGGGLIRGARLKQLGMKRGLADILIRGDGLPPLWIELKTAVGVAHASQLAFADSMISLGDHYALCRSVEQVQAAIQSWRGAARRVA